MCYYNTNNIFIINNPIKSFHLAEGPGGFIEATAFIRNIPDDVYYGMTLMNKDGNIPGWKKAEKMIIQAENDVRKIYSEAKSVAAESQRIMSEAEQADRQSEKSISEARKIMQTAIDMNIESKRIRKDIEEKKED